MQARYISEMYFNPDSPSYPLPPAVIVVSGNKGFHKHFVQFKRPAKIKYRL